MFERATVFGGRGEGDEKLLERGVEWFLRNWRQRDE
jgi:hypothetical protein